MFIGYVLVSYSLLNLIFDLTMIGIVDQFILKLYSRSYNLVVQGSIYFKISCVVEIMCSPWKLI